MSQVDPLPYHLSYNNVKSTIQPILCWRAEPTIVWWIFGTTSLSSFKQACTCDPGRAGLVHLSIRFDQGETAETGFQQFLISTIEPEGRI